MRKQPAPPAVVDTEEGRELPGYTDMHAAVVALLETARRASARAVNAVMTAAYWEIGRQLVEYEQGGQERAAYGEQMIARLSTDLLVRFGRGFSAMNLRQMRRFYLAWQVQIQQTVSVESAGPAAVVMPTPVLDTAGDTRQIVVHEQIRRLAARFPLPWSHYVRLMGVKNPEARSFYEIEALRGGWTVRQLDRQIGSQFYERTILSRNKAAMLRRGALAAPEDAVSPEEEIKDPFVLEFLNLKDEYSENELEEALIRQLETFLLELGGDFTFVGRQRRLRIGDVWFRVDLLFFHRGLRCLVVIDLKLGAFTHADAGQMHLYLNYARENWMKPGENPPVGLILCAQKEEAVAHYALEGLPNKVLAAEYRTALPDERELAAEIARTRRLLESSRVPAEEE